MERNPSGNPLRPVRQGLSAFFWSSDAFARGAELLKPQTYFGMRTVFDFSADQAVQDCTASGGQVVGAAEPCPEGVGPPGFFCVGCCQQAGSQSSAAPVHTLKLSDLGTPPFKLQR